MKAKITLIFLILLFSPLIALINVKAQPTLILFDNRHYYNADNCDQFIDDLKAKYGDNIVILINDSSQLNDYIDEARLLILPNPDGTFEASDIDTIRNFVEGGGALLVMGNWHKYIEAGLLNQIVDGTGILFTETSVYDEDHYDYKPYCPLIGTWTPYPLSDDIKNGVTEDIKYDGAMLVVEPPAVILLLTYDTAYAKDGSGTVVASGAIPVAAMSYLGNGIVCAIGSSMVMKTEYFYNKDEYGNKEFLLAVVDWLYQGNGYIGVQVLDADGSHPISGATVKLDTTTSTTDNNGITAFKVTPSTDYTLTVENTYGKIHEETVSANKGAFITVNDKHYDYNIQGQAYDVETNGTIESSSWNPDTGELTLSINCEDGTKSLTIIYEVSRLPEYVKVDGNIIARKLSYDEFVAAAPNVWYYDEANKKVYIKVQHSSVKDVLIRFTPPPIIGGEAVPVDKMTLLLEVITQYITIILVVTAVAGAAIYVWRKSK
ncbi:MAG: hypothetical protein DRJ32_06140 [Thermoprotei archaeon]|nr:MAG: hypothetical protein DRJ32_06140 [Thermoprotei archaeon]